MPTINSVTEFSDIDSKRWNLKKLSGGAASRIITLLRHYSWKCKVDNLMSGMQLCNLIISENLKRPR